ncbi:MAG TPA: MmpS family transport accessory protein [Nocardioides sp.]
MTQYPQDPQDPHRQPGPQQPYQGQQPPYPGQQWQQQPPKKKHTVRNVFLVLGILAVLGIGGCVALVAGVGNEIDKQSNEVHTVVYKVTGTAKAASLTYTTDGSTTTEQINSAPLPWSKSLQIKGGIIPVYQVMAQNMSGSGTVICSIEVDGTVVKTATGSGEASIASCDYTP